MRILLTTPINGTTINNHTRLYLTILLLIFFLTGCSSVPVEPFSAFSRSMSELNVGTNQAIADLIPQSEKRLKRELIAELEKGETALFESLEIKIDESSPLKIKTTPGIFTTEQFKIGINQATESLLAYAQLLLKLADPELLPEKTFAKMAENLNTNVYQNLNTSDNTVSAQSQKNIALFSNLAIAATKTYLQTKRKQELVAVLEKNQDNVTQFAEHMQLDVIIIAQAATNEYQEEYQQLARKVAIPVTRAKAIDQIIELDRNYLQQIETFNALYNAYGKISDAHAELVKAITRPESSLDKITSIIMAGKKLKISYQQSLTTNKVASIQANADKILAQADTLEAEAETAALRYANAKAAAIQARTRANNTPTDKNKQENAKALENKADELKKEAETKKDEAKQLREAAKLVQEKVNDIKARLVSTL